MTSPQMKILIATPCFGGNLDADFSGCLLNSLKHLGERGIHAEIYQVSNESYIGRARNNCAAFFLRGDYDKLLFIDADQTWRNDELDRLVDSKRTVVGGVYSKKTLPLDLNFTPLPAHSREFFPSGSKPPEAFLSYAKLADESGEIEVQHLATGFLMISREVFEALKEGCPSYLTKDNQHAEEVRHWEFFPCGVLQERLLTEDFFFCSQAREAGHPPYLSIYAMPGHIGKFNYSVSRAMRPQPGGE